MLETRIGRLFLFVFLPVGVIVGGAAAAIITMALLREEPETVEDRNDGLAVFVQKVVRDDVTLNVSSQGEVRPRTEIALVPQVAGKVVAVSDNFLEGAFFSAGETLIQIEDADYRLAVTRADGEVARAASQLESELAQAEIARRDWEELGRGPASSLTLREPQVANARAQLASAEATLADAQLALERTRISAPFEGRVRAKGADIGQYVTPGQSLGQVFATDSLQVRLPLSDQDLALIGLPVAYAAASPEAAPVAVLKAKVGGQAREWRARITRTDSAIDPRTRTVFAIAEVFDPYGAGAADGTPLPVGLFAEARIAGREIKDAVVLPRSALRLNNKLFVAGTDGALTIRDAQIVDSTRDTVVIRGGAETGEYVITSAILSAVDGMPVRAFTQDNCLMFPQPALVKEDAEDAEDAEERPARIAQTGEDPCVAVAEAFAFTRPAPEENTSNTDTVEDAAADLKDSLEALTLNGADGEG